MSLIKLFFLYLRLSLWTFGGGVVLLRFLERELVQRSLLSREDMQETITLAVSIPGSIMANIAFLTGKRLRGWAGAVVALTGTVLPPFTIIIAIAGVFFRRQTPSPWVHLFLQGVLAAVAALVLDVALERLNQLRGKAPATWIIVVAVLFMALMGLHPLLALLAGACLQWISSQGGESP